jgi:riboflavin biosynthesis pyrimidine reductase
MTIDDDIALDSWNADAVKNTYAWPQRLWVRANLVTSVSGQTAGPSGTSRDLTTADDRKILRLIRRDCDALIVGAASIRAEGWHLPPRGHTYVVSQGSPLPWPSCPDIARVTEWAARPDENLNALTSRLVAHLAETGASAILCEGGVATVRALAAENLLDELCLTVRGAHLADAQHACASIFPDSPPWLRTSAMLSEDGATIFSVWRCATEKHS